MYSILNNNLQGNKEALDAIFEKPESSTHSLMLTGLSQTCKTALLMQAAINEANNGQQVLFVSPRKLSRFPPSIHGMPQPSSFTMKSIDFLYAQSCQELQGYLSSLHLRPLVDRPSVIIVDDLNHYCTSRHGDASDELCTFSKLSSLICESAFFSATKTSHDSTTSTQERLALMSWNLCGKSHVKLHELIPIARRHVRQVWNIKKKGDNFEMETETKSRFLTVNFSLRSVNPTSKVIFLQDIMGSMKAGLDPTVTKTMEPEPKSDDQR